MVSLSIVGAPVHRRCWRTTNVYQSSLHCRKEGGGKMAIAITENVQTMVPRGGMDGWGKEEGAGRDERRVMQRRSLSLSLLLSFSCAFRLPKGTLRKEERITERLLLFSFSLL